MSLADLINKRDAEVAAHKEATQKLWDNANLFMNDIRDWEMRNRWRLEDYPDDNGWQVSFLWLGMRFWPKLMTDAHLNYVKGFSTLYMCTISTEQAEALRTSWFDGHASGSVQIGRRIEWTFNYRQDGWVELLIGRM